MTTAGMLIGGTLREAAERAASVDPSTGQPWTEIPWASAEDVDAAVQAAREAFDIGRWSSVGEERGRFLREIAAAVRTRSEHLAEIESRDNGKPLWQTRIEVQNVPRYFEYFAGLADKIEGSYFDLDDDLSVTVRREPFGVVAAIITWNSPLILCAMKLAPALCCGNTVVLKPAENASASTLALGALLREVGLPPGVVNIVTGGVEVGQALIEHSGVDFVTFTGGDKTAESVLASAASSLKPVKIEAGGKAAHIVFEDADLAAAMTATVAGAFISAGQSCTAGSRVLVHDSIWKEFTASYAERVRRLRLGPALDSRTHLGPLATMAQRDKVEHYVDLGLEQGAVCLAGGSRPDDPALSGGYFYRPTVFSDVSTDMAVAQDEIFGPVATLIRFEDEADAITKANSVRYGLASGLWTSDVGRVQRVTQALQAGMLWVNCYRILHWAVPFGGYRRSGMGRENGMEAVREYTQVKSVMVSSEATPSDPFHLEI